MSFVNFMSNSIWSEEDIVNRGRAVIASAVSEARQNELRTIMLGHIAQMRAATAEELQEIGLVQALTEQAAINNAQSRADMALLLEVMAFEANPEGLTLGAEAQAIYDLRHPVLPEPAPAPAPEPTPEPQNV